MILSYIDLQGQRHEVGATVTADHAASSYGIPVIVLSDGEALDASSWILLNYAVVQATPRELADLTRALVPYATPRREGER